MAYNLESLITILKQMLNPEQTRWILDHNIKPQLESLLDKSASLQQMFDKSPVLKMENLESRIREAAHEAEDIIESHMIDQMSALPTRDLEQVTQQLDSVMAELMQREETEKMAEVMRRETASTDSSWSGAPLQMYPSEYKSVVVGVDQDLISLKDRLTGGKRKLEIVPIVGMGGIGKTTLARKLYRDLLITEHFDVRAWVTISQEYNSREVLLHLVRGIRREKVDQYIGISIDELKQILYQIKASRLVRMWVAEGFLRSTGAHKTLEEEAEDCLNDLVQRNLLIVRDRNYNRNAKWFSVHDVLRDLCLRKADEENFLYINNQHQDVSSSNQRPRRVSVHKSSEMEGLCASAESFSLARSFLGAGPLFRGILSPAFLMLRLLRVLDVMEMKFQKFPTEIFQLINLRYLAVWCYSSLPSGISRLWNLQTLIASFGWGDLPCEIWEMPELRHLKLNEVIWVEDDYIKAFVQRMLQKISSVMLTPSLLRNGFFESIPNIKDLGICCDLVLSSSVDLSHLHKLQILRCQSSRRQMLPNLIFPHALRKPTLADCVIFPSFSRSLCALPNLQVLNIKRCVFESELTSNEWDLEEGDSFGSLRLLRLERLEQVRWIAEAANFPMLEHLLLVCCYKLEKIPMDIGEIPTLKLLELYECSRSAEDSARQIVEEQCEYGNDDIRLEIV